MIYYNNRTFIKCLRLQKFIFSIPIRRESTSIMKSQVDSQELFEKKMKFYMKTYEDLFGITKLTEMQDRVIEVQTRLQSIQEKRRHAQEEVFIVQKKLQEMQDILHKTSVGDDMYISVVTQVRELLKEQKRLQDVFSLYDQTEREYQTTLALAINNSQDHERTYREKNKYLSLITGIMGAFLGLVGSSINNWRHKKDIKRFASDISDKVIDLKQSVDKLQLVVLPGAPLNTAIDIIGTNDVQSTLKSQHDETLKNINSLKSVLQEGSVHQVPGLDYSDEHVKDTFSNFEKNIDAKLKKYAYVNLSLISSCVLYTILFFVYIAKNN